MTIGEFGEAVALYIIDSNPAVLSVGYRCMNIGYSFLWPQGGSPYFLLPNGKVCPLATKGYAPYLYPGAAQSKPKESIKTRCFACICEEISMPLCGECVSRGPGKPSSTYDASAAEDH